jgi:hypothetical protein
MTTLNIIVLTALWPSFGGWVWFEAGKLIGRKEKEE